MPVGPEHKTPNAQAVASEGKRGRNASKDDLDRSMVIWTRAVAVFTAFLAFLAGLQAWIIWGQWGEMKATREGGDKSFDAQLAVMQAQAKATQGQLDQMTVDQRPWLAISDLKFNDITVYPVGAGILIDSSYKLTNLGRSPATEVIINTNLVFSDRESFNDQSTRSLCNEHPSTDDRLLATHNETILPRQVVMLESYPLLKINFAATFSHHIEELENAGVSSVAADFFLAGCITYESLGNEAFHHTGFAYKAQGLNVKMPGYPFARIPFDKGLVKEDLVVLPSPYGNFAD